MEAELAGRVALVTGGGRGIGVEIARQLAKAGMRVAVSARTTADVEAVAAEIGGLALVGDVSRREDVAAWIDATERRLGPIDVVVNNAAIVIRDDPTWELEPEQWWRVHEVNVLGPFLVCREVIPRMLERGSGRLVTVGSRSAYYPGLRVATYGASKAAVTRFSEILATQLRERGLPLFIVDPGIVNTANAPELPLGITSWTSPTAAGEMIRKLATGSYDALAGLHLHVEQDADLDALLARIEEVRHRDLNAIRRRVS